MARGGRKRAPHLRTRAQNAPFLRARTHENAQYAHGFAYPRKDRGNVRNRETARLVRSGKSTLDLGKEGLPLLSAADTLLSLEERERRLEKDFAAKWGEFPSSAFDEKKVIAASQKEKDGTRIAKRYAASVRFKIRKEELDEYYADLLRIAENRAETAKRVAQFAVLGCKTQAAATDYAADLVAFVRAGEKIYADFEPAVFFESARFMRVNSPYLYLEYYAEAYERAERTRGQFRRIFNVSGAERSGEIGEELDRVAVIAKTSTVSAGGADTRPLRTNVASRASNSFSNRFRSAKSPPTTCFRASKNAFITTSSAAKSRSTTDFASSRGSRSKKRSPASARRRTNTNGSSAPTFTASLSSVSPRRIRTANITSKKSCF